MNNELFEFELFLQAKEAIDLLSEKKKTLCCCESLTGGGVCAQLVRVSGASKVFLGGIVSYTDEIKKNVVGVHESVLKEKSAVSRECAIMMAENTRKKFGATYCLSLTGFAQSCDDLRGHHEPLVFIALSKEGDTNVMSFSFEGDRQTVQKLSAQRALIMLCEELKK